MFTYKQLGLFTPTTLAAMIADISQYLAEQYDGGDVISAQEWDATHTDMLTVYNVLATLVEDVDEMLMEAGADSKVIYENPAS